MQTKASDKQISDLKLALHKVFEDRTDQIPDIEAIVVACCEIAGDVLSVYYTANKFSHTQVINFGIENMMKAYAGSTGLGMTLEIGERLDVPSRQKDYN